MLDASANNEPIITFGKVTVKETKQSVSTDFRGNYFFENLSTGIYTLEFTFLGYSTYSQEIVIKENETLEVDAYIKPSHAINFDTLDVASVFPK